MMIKDKFFMTDLISDDRAVKKLAADPRFGNPMRILRDQ